jgi:hypothetical protein
MCTWGGGQRLEYGKARESREVAHSLLVDKSSFLLAAFGLRMSVSFVSVGGASGDCGVFRADALAGVCTVKEI